MRKKLRVAGVNTLRRKRQKEILVELQTLLFKHREQNFVRCSRISGRLENDQLATTQTFRNLFRRREDVRNVRLLGFAQRRRNANDDCVAIGQVIEIRSGLKSLRVHYFFEFARRHVANVRSAGVDLFGLRLVNLKAGAFEAFRGKLDQQRQPDIAKSDNAHVGLFVCDAID